MGIRILETQEVGLGIWLGVGGYNFCWVLLGHVNVFGWVVRVVGASTHPLQRAMAIRAGVQSLIPLGVTLTLCSVQCWGLQACKLESWMFQLPRNNFPMLQLPTCKLGSWSIWDSTKALLFVATMHKFTAKRNIKALCNDSTKECVCKLCARLKNRNLR
jgi:hypothetical protein